MLKTSKAIQSQDLEEERKFRLKLALFQEVSQFETVRILIHGK